MTWPSQLTNQRSLISRHLVRYPRTEKQLHGGYVSKLEEILQNTPNRRSFLKQGVVAGAAVAGAGILGSVLSHASTQKSSGPTTGDIAVLRFLAAAEIIETDLWTQYTELGGVTNGTQNAYQLALQQLDPDGSQY